MNQLINDMLITLKFGTDVWRIESEPIEGKSNLKLFANDELVFEGRYEELILKLKGSI